MERALAVRPKVRLHPKRLIPAMPASWQCAASRAFDSPMHLFCECVRRLFVRQPDEHGGLDLLHRVQQAVNGGALLCIRQLVVLQLLRIPPVTHHQALQPGGQAWSLAGVKLAVSIATLSLPSSPHGPSSCSAVTPTHPHC